MLLIANVRRVRISKCLQHAELPTKRLASLTGAIQRGARKSRDVGGRTEPNNPRPGSHADKGAKVFGRHDAPKRTERSERHKSRFSSADEIPRRDEARARTERYIPRHSADVDTAFKRDGIRSSPRTATFRQQGVTRVHALPSQFQQPKNDKSEPKGDARYPIRRPQAAPGQAHSRLDSGRDEQDESGYPVRGREDDSGEFRRRTDSKRVRQGGSRYFNGDVRVVTQDRQPKESSLEGEMDRDSFPTKRHVTVPLSIPRSSAASEFIYGTSAVKAALRAGTRKLYKLYIYQGASGTEQREGDKEFFRLAQERDLNARRLGGEDLRLLDKMSQGRPHNGYVLEASQLPNTPVEALDKVAQPGDGFSFTAGYQSAEEISVNGPSSKIPGNSSRYPFVLMLDSILDPGNLGAIVRSAAFFGVDAIALVDHNLAPFSPVTLKASSGAAEYMRYLKVKRDYDFVKRSKSNGWKFFAAVAPESVSARRGGPRAVQLKEAEEALKEGPCVLMLGGEGNGLRPRLQKTADGVVGIEGAGSLNIKFGLDSLNVSVAAALMMQIFVKGSNAHADTEVSETEAERTEDDQSLF